MIATSTSYLDAIVRPDRAGLGILFSRLQNQFLVRQPPTAFEVSRGTNEFMGSAPPADDRRIIQEQDILVRLPSLTESKGKVIVLQRWVGRVVLVEPDRFSAVVDDATRFENPSEQVQIDVRDVPESDLPLLTEGAIFYWSIGYYDSPGGQRNRISTLRFARQPRLTESDVSRIFEDADHLTAYLESD